MPKKRRQASKKRKPTGRRKQLQAKPQRESTWTDYWWIGVVAVTLLLVAVILWFTVGPGKLVASTPTDVPTESTETEKETDSMPANPTDRNNMYSQPPEMQIDSSKTYVATFETEKGDIVVELSADKVPNTVNNFVFLSREGFYDNTTFHRVLEDFMAQGGDPTGTGSGGPGYKFLDEFHPELRHDCPGILSMTNSGLNTNGSQFFITYKATSWLDNRHSVFGQVIEGMDVLNSISLRDPGTATTPGDLIKTIRIEER